MEKGRILVVDDNPSIRGPLCFLLEDDGYTVDIAGNGKEALQKVRSFNPDLMFLDVMMPIKSGYEVCQIIKANPDTKHIYVIMLSAKGKGEDKQEGLEAGADEYIFKPFSPLKIVAKVHTILQTNA